MTLNKIPKSDRAVLRPPARSDPERMQSNPRTPAASVPGRPESAADFLSLQHSLGNRAVQRLLASRSIQAKLQVGPADDSYEQEADKVAAQVLSSPPAAEAGPAPDQTDPAVAQPKSAPTSTSGGVEAGNGLERQVNGSKGSGGALPEGARTFMESRFGADFGGVRVHTSNDAAQLNRAVQSDAFTHGQDIYFNAGKFNPGSRAGQQLLAHELTHVVQQGSASQLPGSASQLRRKAGVQVQNRLPANRLSTKKQKLYLDFVRMKRLDPQFSKVIGGQLGLKKLAAKSADQSGGTYGHWWTELGDMTGDYPGAWDPMESYGWWPKNGVSGLKETFKGVEGSLNQGQTDDPHHGEAVSASQMFHPVMEVDTSADYEKVRDKVIADIRSNAKSYKGKWAWRLGWGQNCHTFQQWLKKKVGIHHQKGVGWFKRPDTVDGIAAAAKKKKEKEDAEAFNASHPGVDYRLTKDIEVESSSGVTQTIPKDSVVRGLDIEGWSFSAAEEWSKVQVAWNGQEFSCYKDDVTKNATRI